MPTAALAKVDIESGVTAAGIVQLTDSGDNTIFTSAAKFWSNEAASAPVVAPNGVRSGGAITPATSGTDDLIDVAALTVCQSGIDQSISASTDFTVTRPVTNGYMIVSITVNSSQAIVEVAGTEHASAHSETRGAAGGPPLIPVDSVEIGQVRYSSTTSAAVLATEIFQVQGTHQERWNFPGWTVLYGRAVGNAGIQFDSALPDIHTGSVAKEVFVSYSTPIFAEVQNASDYVPSETSQTVSSTQVYNKTVGATSATLNQGSFNALINDGVADLIIQRKNKISWIRFYPDRNKSPYIMSLGAIGIARSFPAGDNIAASVTISSEEASFEIES